MTESNKLQGTDAPIYSRKKNIDIYLLPSGTQFRVVAEVQDHVHHMHLTMLVDHPSLKIRDIQCEMPGVPDELCREASISLQSMVGKRAIPGLLQELDGDWVRTGCSHLKNLFYEACYNVAQAQRVQGGNELARLFPGIREEQMYKIFFWFRPEIANSCIRYADNAPFMQKIKTTELPEGAEKLKAAVVKQ